MQPCCGLQELKQLGWSLEHASVRSSPALESGHAASFLATASPPTPATADTINQALTAVKAAFPPDSTILSDLQLTASDDQTASITIVVNDSASGYGSDGIWPIISSIWDQFDSLSIPQVATIVYCIASDTTQTYACCDMVHNWAMLAGSSGTGDSS
jgi:hypothetical protein